MAIHPERAQPERTLLVQDGQVRAVARHALEVDVHLSLGADREGLGAAIRSVLANAGSGVSPRRVEALVASAVSARIADRLEHEFDALQRAYGAMLDARMPEGTDQAVLEALTRTRLRHALLEGAQLVDQAQACELLGRSTANPSATMKRLEQKGLLRFLRAGRAAYPLFQFDTDAQQVHPVVPRILAARPEGMSDFAVLQWFSAWHEEFQGPPRDHLARAPEAVFQAFLRSTEAPQHG
ncbi:hypothetical protein KM176_15935 [Pseudooceanicola sp. CBS1P-1]|uniref:Uncharacterized protein n=1 Tax=Pseudooceanicola albus TaxID=2692189 RepID=A0A6L7G5M0_9RHOB|nr:MULTISPECIES: hypothetical protein [Pseudooceanicola]MBT9385363.1 hypothetical protein [Pseudooceanicola endophyticus]MXN18778.1 hypothetical protein [Pseudooceanicola albus]